MKNFKHIIAPVLLSATALASSAFTITDDRALDPIRKIQMATAYIRSFYADTVNVDRVVEQGIIGMLKELDPHSTYTTAEETKALTEPLNGNFSGIGVQFQMVQDTVYVIQAVAGGPCEKVGIIPGDRIVAANDTVIAGMKMPNSKVMKHLRGPKGSLVNLKVVRRSEPDTLVFRVTRDDIPLHTIDVAYMADPTTGYVRISSFGAETGNEFIDALKQLRSKGMKNLIIDLQDNGGGYLSAAVALAQEFLPSGADVVYTEGLNQPAQYYKAQNKGADKDSRVVVLVNEYSASASEIFSGALQDNDRGLIVGRRTFGKGLVQRPFAFSDGSMIRLTTAHYYTPSGRSIQKPYERGKDEEYRDDVKNRIAHGELYSADSVKLDLSKKFQTKNGRVVYGGGGIMPDEFVPVDTTGITKYFRDLRAKNVLNQFVVDYVEHNRKALKKKYPNEDAFIKKFEVTPAIMAEFTALAEKLGVEPNEEQLEQSREYIVGNIKGLIGRDLFTTATYYRVMNPTNPMFLKALELINNPGRYNELLNRK